MTEPRGRPRRDGTGDQTTDYEQCLLAFAGRRLHSFRLGQDPVNVPMVRHWVEAMGDDNPVYLSEEAARVSGRAGIVAPASMTQSWTMRGYTATVRPSEKSDAFQALVRLLDDGGYTSVVATDSDLKFHRELVPGDHVGADEVVESISPEKTTALGPGRFVTTVRTYRDQRGDTVATQRWRTLRFNPEQRSSAAAARAEHRAPAETQRPRPRPALNLDNHFWFEAARQRRLVVQRCTSCKTLRHPPGPCCPRCQSVEWDTVEAAGRGTVHSYVVAHHPRHPAFQYPLLIAVVELEEGTRLITNLVGVAPQHVRIDMPVRLAWHAADDDLNLPVFRPTTDDAKES